MHSSRTPEADNRPSGADNRSNAEEAKHLQSPFHAFSLPITSPARGRGVKVVRGSGQA